MIPLDGGTDKSRRPEFGARLFLDEFHRAGRSAARSGRSRPPACQERPRHVWSRLRQRSGRVRLGGQAWRVVRDSREGVLRSFFGAEERNLFGSPRYERDGATRGAATEAGAQPPVQCSVHCRQSQYRSVPGWFGSGYQVAGVVNWASPPVFGPAHAVGAGRIPIDEKISAHLRRTEGSADLLPGHAEVGIERDVGWLDGHKCLAGFEAERDRRVSFWLPT